MNGVHDLGGAHGHGPVMAERNEPVFHAEWERRVMGMLFPVMASANFGVDEFRYGIEQMGQVNYLNTSYYEHWLSSMERLLLERGVVTSEELKAGKAGSAVKSEPAMKAEMVPNVLQTGGSTRMPDAVQPRFKVGDRVRGRNINPVGHTRLPRYARGKLGVVSIDHGVFHTPDTLVAGQGPKPQHVFSVSFTATELWGDEASPQDTARIDLWDDYLEKA